MAMMKIYLLAIVLLRVTYFFPWPQAWSILWNHWNSWIPIFVVRGKIVDSCSCQYIYLW